MNITCVKRLSQNSQISQNITKYLAQQSKAGIRVHSSEVCGRLEDFPATADHWLPPMAQ
jgi:hypothetical protein